MRVTYISLSEEDRTLAAMRSAELHLTLSEYFGQLVRVDCEKAGLAAYLGAGPAEDSRDTTDDGRTP